MSFRQAKSWANWLRDAPLKYGDFFANTGIENAQAAYDPLESVEFPRDVARLHDQMRRGWNVGEIPGVLALEALLQLTDSMDILHAKLNELEAKLFRDPCQS